MEASLYSGQCAFRHLPGVLSFQRSVVITDGVFTYLDEKGAEHPVPVINHGIRATQGILEKKDNGDKNGAVSQQAIEVANLQEIESAKTPPDMRRVIVRFSLRTLDLSKGLHACASSAKNKNGSIADNTDQLRKIIEDFTERTQRSEGVREVSRRIARNVCNARWLWRNLDMASAVRVEVEAKDREEATGHWVIENAIDVPRYHFDDLSDEERAIAEVIASGLCGNTMESLSVKAEINYGVNGALEVYCSQNYEPKPDSRKKKHALSRSLYKMPYRPDDQTDGVRIVGQAAFRDAKIWNALRTIDTWYSETDEDDFGPIPIEPTGASLNLMRFMREKDQTAFAMLKRLHQIDPDSEDGMFVIASLIRGGVFSEKEKEENGANSAKTNKRDEEAKAAGQCTLFDQGTDTDQGAEE